MTFKNDHHLTGNIAARYATSGTTNAGNLAAQMQADPKKQGKEKKPDRHLVSRTFPEQ